MSKKMVLPDPIPVNNVAPQTEGTDDDQSIEQPTDENTTTE